jgi:hypothetical protein
VPIVLPPQGDRVVGDGDESMIRDRDAVGVWRARWCRTWLVVMKNGSRENEARAIRNAPRWPVLYTPPGHAVSRAVDRGARPQVSGRDSMIDSKSC